MLERPGSGPNGEEGKYGDLEDVLLPDAVTTVVTTGAASVALLQRRLRVGYARAGRLIDLMEERGIISGFDGSKARKVLIDEGDVPHVLSQLGAPPSDVGHVDAALARRADGVILTGIVPFAELAGPDAINAPIAFALGRIGISWGAAIVSVGALCGMTSVILVMLFGQSRIFFAMSRDGLLPAFFSEISQKTQTPAKVIVVTGAFTALSTACAGRTTRRI